MVALPGTRAILAAWSAIQAAIYPEGACDAETRRAFEDEARESNARTLRWAVWVAAPVNAIPVVVFLRRPQEDPANTAWVFWLVSFNTVLATLWIVGAIVAWRRRPAALWRALGDLAGMLILLGSAARSANAQRAHPNLNLFVAGALATAFFLRMRPRIFAPALLGAAVLVLGGIAHFQQRGTARVADELALLGISSLALLCFFFARSVRVRELLARREVERLNAELERRVEAQVGEIVKRAGEIEALNSQLNQKISERSRELSNALARLAEGHGAIEPGTVLGGRVEIGAKIGEGGMGVVYRGRDLVTHKMVAVKVVQAGSANELDGLHRFLHEARAMASMTHGAIVRSIHVDVSEDGRLFQMMEFVEGETLESHLARSGPLPVPVACRVGAVLAAALAAAHAAGVVHLDVKPSNVMLTRAAPGLKLLDFGIAKLRDAQATNSQTQRQVLGTPDFLSPEQVSDPAGVDAPADVYALGLLLYLCVAGRMPFDVKSSPRWLTMLTGRAPVELSTRLPGVDPALARAVMACLQKNPEDRPTAEGVADTLSKIAEAAGTPPLEELDLVQKAGSAPRVVPESAPTAKC
jgi:serine/threonine-protein kinase